MSHSPKLIKFGGSSVATPERLQAVAKIIVNLHSVTQPVIAVVSAFQGVTDQLIEIAYTAASGKETFRVALNELNQRHIGCLQTILPAQEQSKALANIKVWLNELEDILQGIFQVGECSPRALDYVMSFGERLSAYSLSALLNSLQHKTDYCDARNLITCENIWGHGRVLFPESNTKIQAYFRDTTSITIVTGFIASTNNEDTITLGRGGSDYTASILGAALNCKEIEIWTDVSGVMTADPRKVPKAFSIPEMSYAEIMELAHFGAKVVYPPTIQPALNAGIQIKIKNTFQPEHPGTLIKATASQVHLISGISSLSHIALLRLEGSGMIGVAGSAMRLFKALAEAKISIILITQASSEHTICFAVMPDKAELAKTVVESEFQLEINQQLIAPVLVEQDLSIVSIVGENMRQMPGISARLFSALGKNSVNVKAIAQGSSELNISVVIDTINETKALNALHDAFFLSENRTANIFIAGTGLIGSTLLKQINARHSDLQKDLNLDLILRGVTNSRQCWLVPDQEQSNAFANYATSLAKAPKLGISEYIQHILDLNLPNSIFVDCTASQEVADQYERLLNNSIAVITPNKRAQTSDYAKYSSLRRLARKRSTTWLYETSVGAGLPIINTLNDLISSGDQIIKIEAVLSGTLSYIFNNFDGSLPFSSLVLKAKELGFTEPDPREDLGGADFGRKLLILAREAGFINEQGTVSIEQILPSDCLTAQSVPEFFTQLEKHDQHFLNLLNTAKKQNGKLSYIGIITPDAIKVSLQTLSSTHPFYDLSGSDNIVCFTTTRYQTRPLVIKGPGAGAEVTAAGVFADIIRAGQKH